MRHWPRRNRFVNLFSFLENALFSNCFVNRDPGRWDNHTCERWLRHIRFGHCEVPEPVALRLYTRLQRALKVDPTIKTAAVNFGICPPIVMSSTGSPSGASSPFALRASLSSHVRN